MAQAEDGTWVAQIESLPVDGKANLELIDLVAAQMGCAKAAVSIKTGQYNQICGADEAGLL